MSRRPAALARGRRHRPSRVGRPSRLLGGVVLGVVAGVLGLLVVAPTASAHEFGPFAINRYAALLVGPDRVDLDYVVDYAETPTQADGDAIEADVPGTCAERLAEMELLVDGEPVSLSLTSSSSLRQDGDGGLTTLRIECDFGAPLTAGDATRQMSFEDDNYRERVGWREILVVGDRTAIDGDVTDDSVTDRLTDFPAADENPDLASVTFAFTASADVEPATLDRTAPGDDDGEGGDAFSDLIADADGGVLAMVTALGFAAFLGALHSLAPGHGKTVIGAYLVGTRGTKFQAFVLAVAVALSHTLGVLVLGIITYIAGAAFAPERVYPWLQGLSALIVTGIGIWLVVTAYREWRARATGAEPPHHHTLHAHGHLFDEHDDHVQGAADDDAEHVHALPPHVLARAAGATVVAGTAVVAEPDHTHPHDHGGHAGDGHSHDHGGHAGDGYSHDHGGHAGDGHSHEHDGRSPDHTDSGHDQGHGHTHDHDHDHDHGHTHDHDGHTHDHDGHDHSHAGDHDHGHDHDHDHGHTHDHDHGHTHDHDHDHSHDHGGGWHRHGIFPHTHKYDFDELDLTGKVSWKTLAVLGLSGGLVPSTSAIIVLLGAIQLNRIAFGGLLILAFGIGMAIALVSVGLGMVALRDRAFGKMDGNAVIQRARILIVPIAAVAVLLIGVFLVIRAGIEIGDL